VSSRARPNGVDHFRRRHEKKRLKRSRWINFF